MSKLKEKKIRKLRKKKYLAIYSGLIIFIMRILIDYFDFHGIFLSGYCSEKIE